VNPAPARGDQGPRARPSPEELYAAPNALARHYSAFRVSERLLLTGHSHQAWPDVGLEAQERAWRDAAEHVDDKWERAFVEWERVCSGYRVLLDDADGHITLASNTHELLVRFLSALPLGERPRIVTTEAEFHSIRRQLDRLAEERWVEIVKVPGYPAAEVAGRLIDRVDDRTAAVLVSAVFFDRCHIVPGLHALGRACRRVGAALLVDAYHALGVVPFRLAEHDLEDAYVVGGGYKYLQLGEGNCFLRVPAACTLRPVVTGWFAEFGELADAGTPERVRYGRGATRFAGSTFDPTSHYRGAAVFDFFAAQGLEPELLRAVSQHQVGVLVEQFHALDLDPALVRLDDGVGLEARGGFLGLSTVHARALCAALKERGVRTDHRGRVLRFGPAPYLSDAQIVASMQALGEAARSRDVIPPS
jgi:kynureninase